MVTKPLGDEFKCCVCLEHAGKVPHWSHYTPELNNKEDFKQLLICDKCDKSLTYAKSKGKVFDLLDIVAWAARRSRDAEHRRMANKFNDQIYKNSQAMRNLNRLMESKEALSAK